MQLIDRINDRKKRASIAADTLSILNNGGYPLNVDSGWVNISEQVSASVDGTFVVPGSKVFQHSSCHQGTTAIDCDHFDTLAAAERLVRLGRNVAALNFASAKHAGGGWMNGAEAQEENLTRRSALYASLSSDSAAGFYSKAKGVDGLYTHSMVYSPNISVIRNADETLRSEPFLCSFVSAAAPNAGVARRRGVSESLIESTLAERAERVLSCMANQGHDGLVLGAWGCGVFQNHPHVVARTFARLLTGKFRGVFKVVSFPLCADSNRLPFEKVLAPLLSSLPALLASPLCGPAQPEAAPQQEEPSAERATQRGTLDAVFANTAADTSSIAIESTLAHISPMTQRVTPKATQPTAEAVELPVAPPPCPSIGITAEAKPVRQAVCTSDVDYVTGPNGSVHVFKGAWDCEGVFFYQAFNSEIADWSVASQQLGGPGFNTSRMTWIKPSFAWVLYRSGYALKYNQEHILRLKLPHAAVAELLASCACKHGGGGSKGRVQWDPARDLLHSEPGGMEPRKMLRERAIQIGLSSNLSERYIASILEIADVTDLARRVGAAHKSKHVAEAMAELAPELPKERTYLPRCDEATLVRLHILCEPEGAEL